MRPLSNSPRLADHGLGVGLAIKRKHAFIEIHAANLIVGQDLERAAGKPQHLRAAELQALRQEDDIARPGHGTSCNRRVKS